MLCRLEVLKSEGWKLTRKSNFRRKVEVKWQVESKKCYKGKPSWEVAGRIGRFREGLKRNIG